METWTKAQALKAFEEFVSPGKLKTYQMLGMEIVPARREGSRLWDKDGKSYINCRSSGGVFNLGHRPPEILAALTRALETLDLGDHLLLSEWRARLAKRLAELTPGDIQYTTFGVGGGEAVDLAIKLARGYTRRPGIISAIGGYHGHTGFALATGEDSFKEYFGPLAPGFSQVPFGDLEALEEAVTEETAAVIFETIPATLGIVIPPDDYFPAVRKICDAQGAVLIIDEVQAGLGRTGRFWAIDEYQVAPDILVLGKGLSGALYPMSATCYRPRLQSFFDQHPFVHVSTYGGSELGCAVTLAVLDRLSSPELLGHVNTMAEIFAKGLIRLQLNHPRLLIEVRQKGLMIGLKMCEDRLGILLTSQLAQNGVIAMFAHNDPSVMIIMPPLIVTAEEVEEVLAALAKSFQALEGFLR
ncbi:MAG: aminotransferase [Deltaproteobacteria bacterium RBG_13_61_14]|nr:MAG: aminotransferase [Deltaproteobacteria bacterium RBG_13_61_14]